MADIELHRIHNLGLKAARTAAEKMAEQLGRKFDLKGEWHGNVLKFERPGVSGSLAITDKDMNLSVALGFLLKAMKGSIETAVRQELDKLFPAKPASAPPRNPVKAKKGAPPPKKGG
ncbi:MAG: polyhydroxyalkanoic acid system family protein [Pseudomonadota bacterium]|nr:polyhydroxyalkanoic acid system family protein [Pseudomonadota bacterium]